MEPYWSDGQVTLHLGDCLGVLPGLPAGCAQLVIADPPYNLGPKFGNSKEWVRDPGWLAWCNQWLAECQRILAADGNLFVYGIHHFIGYLQVRLYEMGMTYRRMIIWHYENGTAAGRSGLATHYEPVLWFSPGPESYLREIRVPYKDPGRIAHRITKNGRRWIPNPEGALAGDVWDFPTLAGARFASEKVDHPTQKPLALTDRIVTHFSEPGALIVVPFAGSGTECVSAVRNGRRCLATELSPRHAELSRARLQAAADQPPLWVTPAQHPGPVQGDLFPAAHTMVGES